MHEHLDEMGIIHMNGRVYDPLIGRFMSADPFIQSPMDLQSYNRYAYVRNNPLTMSDPTGHFWWWVVAAIVAPEAGRAVGLWDERTTRILQGIGLGIVTGGATVNWFLASTCLAAPTVGMLAVGGAVGGFVSGAVITGNLDGAVNGALSGALSGALFGAAGTVGGNSELAASSNARYAAHAAAGCVTSAAGGGSCGQGAVSAVFGKYSTNQIGSSTLISGDIAKGVATAVAGGVGSVIAGGKFENGAVTAGYGYLFNAMSARGLRDFLRNVSAAGHHFVPYVVSSEAGVSMDAAREFSKSGTGIIPDYGNSDNPHRGHSKAHIEYDRAVRSELDSYLKSNGASASSMTTNQAREFVQQIRTSSVPAIRDFNMAIRAHILNNALKMAPPRGGD